MNTVTKVLLVGGGLAAFYGLRKYADQKFAEQSATASMPTNPVQTVVEAVKKILPEDILPQAKPTPPPPPPPPARTIITTLPLPKETYTPTVVNTKTLVLPKTTTTTSYPLNTLTRKVYSLDQRVLALAGINLR